MAGSYYIKLYIEILDDVKMALLPDWAKWRFVQFMLVAKEHNQNGLLPPVNKIAWRLRLSSEQVEEGLRALEEVGVVATTPDGWLVVNFAKRQAAISSTERSRQSRDMQRKCDVSLQERCIECNEDATLSSYSSSSSDSSSESKDSLTESDSINSLLESASWLPTTPKEAEEHPAIRVFQEATGGRIPGFRDYQMVVSWVVQIAQKHHMNGKDLPTYLNRWFTTWCSRKRSDGQPYDPGNIAWMEWAYNGEAPPERGEGKSDRTAGRWSNAYDAWGEVRTAIVKFGRSNQPDWENPITRKTVESLGWLELCMSTNQASDRARFIEAYNVYLQSEPEEPVSLPQIKELAKKLKSPRAGLQAREEESDV